jgi:hypothetical protein
LTRLAITNPETASSNRFLGKCDELNVRGGAPQRDSSISVRYGFVMLSTRSRDVRIKLYGLAAAFIFPALLSAPAVGADTAIVEQPGGPVSHLSASSGSVVRAGAPADLPADRPRDLPADAPAVIPAARMDNPSMLPPSDAPEQGLQVKTLLAARSISAEFPQITSMIGVRPDAKPWHPNGLAVDVMIPNPGSAEGIALGDAILAYAMRNADRFGLQDVIWRGVYYTPAGPSGSGYGHFDHVHITTTGGGYGG